jgi:hypothetical protein
MKKYFSLFLIAVFSFPLFAQDKGEMKNMRFGATILPALNWYSPTDPKKFKNEGMTPHMGVLINGEYSSDNGRFAFGFGLGIASMGGKISFLDSVRYAIDDDNVLGWNDSTKTSKSYKLNTRTYKASYFLIPISLKMRTNEIGYMRYFLEPRLNIAIRKNVRADDDDADWHSTNSVQQSNLNINTDMAPINLSVTISGGGEYYLSGSTAVTFSLGYQYGLTNTTKSTSDYLERFKNVPTPNTAYTYTGRGQQVQEKFMQSGLVLSVGILF